MAPDQVDPVVERGLRRWPTIDPDVEGIASRITKSARYLDRALAETVAALGLSAGDYRVLVTLGISGPPHRLPISDLRRHHMLSTGAMTVRLDRLEGAGLVSRIRDATDRRSVLIELTNTGRRVVDRAVTAQTSREAELLTAMSAAERAQLNRLLRKLLTSFEQTLGEAPKPR